MSDSVGCVIDGAVMYLKLRGELRHDNAGPLEALIEHCFGVEDCVVRGAVIDLNDVSFLDSTAIGLLAAIARELKSRNLAPPAVFSTNPEINQLLRSLRLDQAFTLVDRATDGRQSSAVAEFAPCPDGETDQCSAAAILRAHETLIDINEGNRAAFQPVVDLLRQQIGADDKP